jgi:thioredoxin reductase
MRNKKIDLNEKLRKVSCDILVIGGGGAGLRAAIGAHDSGADVLIISKSKKGDPHTVERFFSGPGGIRQKKLQKIDPMSHSDMK